MLRFIEHYEDIIQERLIVCGIVLFQIYLSTRVPKIIKIELGLTKLLQNKMVQFIDSQCTC